MQYRRLGSTGLKVSELCFGTATFGWHTEDGEAHRMLDLFLEHGGSFLDTANFYSGWAEGSWFGRSEEVIGAWLASTGRRHETVIATKCCSPIGPLPYDRGLSRRHIMDSIDNSLRRLNTDFVDLYQAHAMDDDVEIEETVRAYDDLVRQGKVRYVGCSNFSTYRLCKSLWASDRRGLARYDCLQPYYSLLERDYFERDLAELIRAEGIGVIPYSPQAMGFLTGKWRGHDAVPANTRGAGTPQMKSYFTDANFRLLDEMEAIGKGHGKTIAQVSIAWVLGNPLITAPIVGARNCEQLQESLGAADFRLTEEEMTKLNEMTAWK